MEKEDERNRRGRETKFRIFLVRKLNIVSSKHFVLHKYSKFLEVISLGKIVIWILKKDILALRIFKNMAQANIVDVSTILKW